MVQITEIQSSIWNKISQRISLEAFIWNQISITLCILKELLHKNNCQKTAVIILAQYGQRRTSRLAFILTEALWVEILNAPCLLAIMSFELGWKMMWALNKNVLPSTNLQILARYCKFVCGDVRKIWKGCRFWEQMYVSCLIYVRQKRVNNCNLRTLLPSLEESYRMPVMCFIPAAANTEGVLTNARLCNL